jgi:hypothetical protein
MSREFGKQHLWKEPSLEVFSRGDERWSAGAHLRPQALVTVSSTGPNLLNPLEAYEVDFSGSNLSLKMKEPLLRWDTRLIIPYETTLPLKVVESVVDMSKGRAEIIEVGSGFFSRTLANITGLRV